MHRLPIRKIQISFSKVYSQSQLSSFLLPPPPLISTSSVLSITVVPTANLVGLFSGCQSPDIDVLRQEFFWITFVIFFLFSSIILSAQLNRSFLDILHRFLSRPFLPRCYFPFISLRFSSYLTFVQSFGLY